MCGLSIGRNVLINMNSRSRVCHKLSYPYNAGTERGNTTKSTVNVVESSSKENVETEKQLPPVCSFKAEKHV